MQDFPQRRPQLQRPRLIDLRRSGRVPAESRTLEPPNQQDTDCQLQQPQRSKLQAALRSSNPAQTARTLASEGS